MLWELTGFVAGDTFGASIAPLGDLNQDGYADIAVGAPNSSAGYGEVYLISGYDATILSILDSNGHLADQFGFSMANIGDLDSDGFDELLIGAYAINSYSGGAFVFTPKNGARVGAFFGSTINEFLGISVSGAGDANQDGTPAPDYLIGAYGASAFAGKAYLLSGATSTVLHEFAGTTADEYLGCAVSPAGDIDQDGYHDVFVGAMGTNDWAGAVHAYSGFDGSILTTFPGSYAGDSLGSAIALVGDTDGDGSSDFVIGAPGYDHARGAAILYSGTDLSVLNYYTGYDWGDYYGWSVAPAGDYDGRLHADFLVGAPGADSESGVDSGYFQAWSQWTPILQPSSYELSASSGGVVFYGLDYPWGAGWGLYQVVVNLAGPGTTLWNGLNLPLKNDGLLQSTIAGDVPAPCLGFAGVLSAYGDGMAAIWVPAGLPASMVGTTYWLASVAGQIGGVWDYASWANPLTIAP